MAVIHVEHEPSALSRSAARPPTAVGGTLEDRLAVRRRKVVSFRRLFVLGDAVATFGVVSLLVADGHLTSAVMAAAVLVAVMAHAYGADSPRTIAALRCVLRPTTVSAVRQVSAAPWPAPVRSDANCCSAPASLALPSSSYDSRLASRASPHGSGSDADAD